MLAINESEEWAVNQTRMYAYCSDVKKSQRYDGENIKTFLEG